MPESATKQSTLAGLRDGLLRGACHRAALRADPVARNDVDKHESTFPRRVRPKFCTNEPLESQREQGMPGARCTRGLVCKMHKEKRTRAYRFSGGIRHSLRNGFTAYAALSPATSSFLSPSSTDKDCLNPVGPTLLRRLSISNGCQDHTVLPYATNPGRLRAVAHSRSDRPANTSARPTLPRPPHPIPRS